MKSSRASITNLHNTRVANVPFEVLYVFVLVVQWLRLRTGRES